MLSWPAGRPAPAVLQHEQGEPDEQQRQNHGDDRASVQRGGPELSLPNRQDRPDA